MYKTKSDGFTLIELLVVIAIIGVLASVVMVALNDARENSKIAAAQKEIIEIAKTAEIARIETGTHYLRLLTNNSYTWGGTMTESVHATRFQTSMQNLVNNTNGTVDGVDSILYDPWGLVYQMDENEGESSPTSCTRDHIQTQNSLVRYRFEYGSKYCKDNPVGVAGFY